MRNLHLGLGIAFDAFYNYIQLFIGFFMFGHCLILNSTNVTFDSCSFLNGIGGALSFFDTAGIVTISDSFFIRNGVPEKDRAFQWGGGGIYIEFTFCPPGIERCNPQENTHNSNSNYTIRNCVFSHNMVTAVETPSQSHIIQYPLFIGSDSNRLAQGGGIAITLKGTGTGNMFTILNCTFTNNTAVGGGGMEFGCRMTPHQT